MRMPSQPRKKRGRWRHHHSQIPRRATHAFVVICVNALVPLGSAVRVLRFAGSSCARGETCRVDRLWPLEWRDRDVSQSSCFAQAMSPRLALLPRRQCCPSPTSRCPSPARACAKVVLRPREEPVTQVKAWDVHHRSEHDALLAKSCGDRYLLQSVGFAVPRCVWLCTVS